MINEIKRWILYVSEYHISSTIISLILVALAAIALLVLLRWARNPVKIKPAAPSTLPSLIGRLWRQFTRRRQHQAILLLLLMLISAFAEMVSLGTVLPFIGAHQSR